MPSPKEFEGYIRDLRAGLQQIRTFLRNPFANTGLSVPGPDVVQVDGALVVQGGEARSGNYTAGSTGWRLRPDGTIEMNDAVIRGGIIGNDALSSPVSPLTAHADGSNFSLATGPNVTKLSITVPVPSGYSQALVIATGNMNANNTTSAADYGYLGLRINGAVVGWSLAGYAPAGIYCNVSNASSKLLTGLGSSFTVEAAVSSAVANWAADSNNTINLDVMVMFLR